MFAHWFALVEEIAPAPPKRLSRLRRLILASIEVPFRLPQKESARRRFFKRSNDGAPYTLYRH